MKARPPPCRATLSQSIRLKIFVTASAASVPRDRCSISSVTMPSMSAIFASSNPWKRQPLNLMQERHHRRKRGIDHLQYARFARSPIAMHADRDGLFGPLREQVDNRLGDGLIIQEIHLRFVVGQKQTGAPFQNTCTDCDGQSISL